MFRKMVENASWIVICKVIQSVITLVIGMITARYLGPSNYGLISYASSIVAFFVPIMQLGLSSTLIQEFINKPDKEGEVLGTSLSMNILSSILSIIGVVAFTVIVNDSKETIIVCFLYSLKLLFQAAEMTQFWFQAKLLSKYPSLASLITYVIVAIYKVYILATGKSIRWFAITHVIEAIIISILLIICYYKLKGSKLSISIDLGKEMFSRSKHYISSGLLVVIFQQTDRIMLSVILNETETGYYSAAITIIGVTGFLFSAIIDTARPLILESKKKSQRAFEDRMVLLFSIITVISLLQSISMTILSKILVLIMFGEAYLPTVQVLCIAVWYVTFGYYGVVRNIWILAEENQKYLWKINLLGASVNILFNALLIPLWGASGAALASLITQVFTNFVLCYILKPIKPCGDLIVRSLNLKESFKLLPLDRIRFKKY